MIAYILHLKSVIWSVVIDAFNRYRPAFYFSLYKPYTSLSSHNSRATVSKLTAFFFFASSSHLFGALVVAVSVCPIRHPTE